MRLDQLREETETPKRFDYAKEKLGELGFEVEYEDTTELRIEYKGNTIKLWPYSGWFSGKGIKDGRGIDNLLSQLEEK